MNARVDARVVAPRHEHIDAKRLDDVERRAEADARCATTSQSLDEVIAQARDDGVSP